MHDPRTPGEWQEAVDAAYACLTLDAARQYGLVTGGPGVNVDRCAELIDRGGRLGFSPGPNAVERMLGSLDVAFDNG